MIVSYKVGTPKNGIIFWRAGPLKHKLPPLGKCSRNPSVSVYQQLALLWEAVLGFSELFLNTLSCCRVNEGNLAPSPRCLSNWGKQFPITLRMGLVSSVLIALRLGQINGSHYIKWAPMCRILLLHIIF